MWPPARDPPHSPLVQITLASSLCPQSLCIQPRDLQSASESSVPSHSTSSSMMGPLPGGAARTAGAAGVVGLSAPGEALRTGLPPRSLVDCTILPSQESGSWLAAPHPPRVSACGCVFYQVPRMRAQSCGSDTGPLMSPVLTRLLCFLNITLLYCNLRLYPITEYLMNLLSESQPLRTDFSSGGNCFEKVSFPEWSLWAGGIGPGPA